MKEAANGSKVVYDVGPVFVITGTDIRVADPASSDVDNKCTGDVAVHCDECIEGTCEVSEKEHGSIPVDYHVCIGT